MPSTRKVVIEQHEWCSRHHFRATCTLLQFHQCYSTDNKVCSRTEYYSFRLPQRFAPPIFNWMQQGRYLQGEKEAPCFFHVSLFLEFHQINCIKYCSLCVRIIILESTLLGGPKTLIRAYRFFLTQNISCQVNFEKRFRATVSSFSQLIPFQTFVFYQPIIVESLPPG